MVFLVSFVLDNFFVHASAACRSIGGLGCVYPSRLFCLRSALRLIVFDFLELHRLAE